MTRDPQDDPRETQLHLAYAEASVMLLECLMIVLVERKLVPMDTLVEAIETAIEANKSQVRDRAHPEIAAIAAGVLSKMGNSLAATGQGGEARHARERSPE